MIKNVVFDVGGVLMDFDTHAAALAAAGNEADARLLEWETFEHPDWIAIDRGYPPQGCIEHMKTRIPEQLHAAVDQMMRSWEDALVPNQEINDLALELARLGYGIYILSNTSETYYHFRERIPAYPVVKGEILSFEEKLLKADPEIYRRLFSRFGLAPGECFFVDDNHLNVEAAVWCGMSGCLYRHDIHVLRNALRNSGVPVAP